MERGNTNPASSHVAAPVTIPSGHAWGHSGSTLGPRYAQVGENLWPRWAQRHRSGVRLRSRQIHPCLCGRVNLYRLPTQQVLRQVQCNREHVCAMPSWDSSAFQSRGAELVPYSARGRDRRHNWTPCTLAAAASARACYRGTRHPALGFCRSRWGDNSGTAAATAAAGASHASGGGGGGASHLRLVCCGCIKSGERNFGKVHHAERRWLFQP